MTKVITNLSVSLDSFVAGPHDGAGQLCGYAADDNTCHHKINRR